jgi:hypothetical protein
VALNQITVDTNKEFGSEVYNAIVEMERAQDAFRRIKEQLDNMTDGVSYTEIETRAGLPTGKGQAFYNLWAGANAHLQSSADSNAVSFQQLLDWVIHL